MSFFFSLAFFFAESLLPFQPILFCLMHCAAGDPTTSAPVLQLNSICCQEVEELVGSSHFSCRPPKEREVYEY